MQRAQAHYPKKQRYKATIYVQYCTNNLAFVSQALSMRVPGSLILVPIKLARLQLSG